MCGVAGLVRDGLAQAGMLADQTRAMGAALAHRGPDDAGIWQSPDLPLAFAHQRLSIVDLSPLGRQPMHSVSGRLTICFNGEIYNYQELRRELEEQGSAFRGSSDTEVLLAGFEAWGLTRTLEKCIGMFAIALWDARQRSLTLVRDRIGVKPLYYGWLEGSPAAFAFGSEIGALEAVPALSLAVSRESLRLYCAYGQIPAPYSVYRGVFKLPAGTILELPWQALLQRPSNFSPQPEAGEGTAHCCPKRFWDLAVCAQQGLRTPFSGDAQAALDALERVLEDSVRLRMVADVPVGAFLSGGTDSSLVTALMQRQSARPIQTFSIGFSEAEFDEAPYARAIAKHLGTEHHELYLSAAQAAQEVPQLVARFSEPFADSSMLPTYLVSQLARQTVTVSLSGDGGDELAAGYPRYVWALAIWRRLSRLPDFSKRGFARVLTAFPTHFWNLAYIASRPLLPKSFQFHDAGEKAHKLASVLTHGSVLQLYQNLLTFWEDTESLIPGGIEPDYFSGLCGRVPTALSPLRGMAFLDTLGYLPDDILVKVDRCSMAVSLEAREPLLDHRLFEFVSSLPESLLIREREGKWILRALAQRSIPKALLERPKRGFAVPLAQWLRGELRDWAESLLSEGALRQTAIFNVHLVRERWRAHLEGRRNWHSHLWIVLVLQAWLLARQSAARSNEPSVEKLRIEESWK
jgi:asparagine synthase (glutamine-hydrolysing)